ncbi:MAG: hypothetical protein AB8B51_12750 [Sedimentitalea sp.]
MSTYKALDAYFKIKDAQGHYETVKAIDVYATKLGGKKVKASDIQFFSDGRAVAANKGVLNALAIYKAAAKSAPKWPKNDTSLFFGSLLRNADTFGFDSQGAKNARQNYRNKCVQYGGLLLAFQIELNARKAKIAKHKLLMANTQAHCASMAGWFQKFARIPSIMTSAEQGQWFMLSEAAVKMAGNASSCQAELAKLEKTNNQTLKDCADTIKTNSLWIKWIETKGPEKPGALKKNLKTTKPK